MLKSLALGNEVDLFIGVMSLAESQRNEPMARRIRDAIGHLA